jgi:SPX domain protein involved in polyphosphate accumulation
MCCISQVRSIYHRTAFQRDDSNAVRISLDSSLRLFKEEPLGPPTKKGEAIVCAPDAALSDTSRDANFPYAVSVCTLKDPSRVAVRF